MPALDVTKFMQQEPFIILQNGRHQFLHERLRKALKSVLLSFLKSLQLIQVMLHFNKTQS